MTTTLLIVQLVLFVVVAVGVLAAFARAKEASAEVAGRVDQHQRGFGEAVRQLTEGTHGLETKLEKRLAEASDVQLRGTIELRDVIGQRMETIQQHLHTGLSDGQLKTQSAVAELQSVVRQSLGEHRETFEKRQSDALSALQEAVRGGMESSMKLLAERLAQTSSDIGHRMEKLTEGTDLRLKEIAGQVEKRLSEGFDKTSETFQDIVKRLATIDSAQQRIQELSSNVVSLQEVLNDKRSRGAFGEYQLEIIVENVLPSAAFDMQYTLPNEHRADCVLHLPKPTGMLAIDAKFPLENFKRGMDGDLSDTERERAKKQFPKDVQKHIKEIAEKYIVPGVTADGAVMFLPSEAIFAEIHAHCPEVIDAAQKARVYITSPTTLMAVVTTAAAMLKDHATREQVHAIQAALGHLAADFGRFEKRMAALARHIDLANRDVEDVNRSAKRICRRFQVIEQVDLAPAEVERPALVAVATLPAVDDTLDN